MSQVLPFLFRFACAAAVVVTLLGCAHRVSSTPLSEDPAGDGYYYGAPDHGGKSTVAESSDSPVAVGGSQKSPAKDTPSTSVAAEGAANGADAGAGSEQSIDPAAVALSPVDAAKKFLGTYVGEDRVAIELGGFPEQVQDDDKAKIRVDVEQGEVSVSVIDTNSGGDLCTVSGAPKGQRVVFPPGQSCFSEMLGRSTQASVVAGRADLEEQKLTVELEVSLELRGPEDTLSGSLRYRFVGTRE